MLIRGGTGLSRPRHSRPLGFQEPLRVAFRASRSALLRPRSFRLSGADVVGGAAARPTGRLELLGSSNFDEIRRGVDALGTSADPRALSMLGAMREERLLAPPDRTLLIREGADWRNATTGESVDEPGTTRVVRLNNTVR